MTTDTETPLQVAVSKYEQRTGSPFVPTKKLFYERVGINQKRFGMLLRGQLPMYGYEVTALAEFFGVEVTEILNNENPVKKQKALHRAAV